MYSERISQANEQSSMLLRAEKYQRMQEMSRKRKQMRQSNIYRLTCSYSLSMKQIGNDHGASHLIN